MELPARSNPGLVGGHCIGVDPYYLSHLAQQVGHNPQVILAGRGTNDRMGAWIADALHERRRKAGTALVLGLTFKENVPGLAQQPLLRPGPPAALAWGTRSRSPIRWLRRRRSSASTDSR